MIDHYEADVRSAQDYYPFGMIMPGRMLATLSIPGGSFSGTTQVNGYTLPVDLSLNSRTGNQPTSYVATDLIDLNDGFESGANDDVTAYIADGSYAGGGNGSNDAGIAGNGYRYGFNGKENDNEVKGAGDQIDYGMRVYDPRIGKFLSVDPLTAKYAFYTPYQFAGNKPIGATDLDGTEDVWSVAKANMDNRKWEEDLRRNDPEHAAEKIYEANKHAFIFTGGMITAGSGTAAGIFFDAVGLYGIGKFTSGIIKKDTKQVKDGMETMTIVATGELSGVLLGKIYNAALSKVAKIPFRAQETSEIVTDEVPSNSPTNSEANISAKTQNTPAGTTSPKQSTRLPATKGSWSGERGNSNWNSTLPEVNAVTNNQGIPFVNNQVDFSKWSVGEFTIVGLTGDYTKDFALVYKKMVSDWGFPSQKAAADWLKANKITIHHAGTTKVELIPTELHGNIPHAGSASELRNQ